MMQYALGVFLILHGIAHLVGFVVSWRIGTLEGAVYRTTVFGGLVDVGDLGTRIVGLLWLGAAVLVCLSGVAVFAAWPSWRAITLCSLLFSLVLCVIGWPESRIGLAVNVALLMLIAISNALGWALVSGR